MQHRFNPRTRLFCLFLGFLTFAILPGAFLAAQESGSLQPDRTLPYRTTHQGELDLHLFLPEGWEQSDQRPAVVFFFGGGWVGGTPRQFYEQSRDLAKRGYVAVSAQYRTYKTHKTTPFACVQDGKAAIRYVRQHAAELGVDPGKIVAAGGSAGGHVAACTGVIAGEEGEGQDLTISSVPNAMVLFNPVLDTTSNGFGAGRFSAEGQTALSPCHHVRPGIVPTLLFHGTADTTVPFENAERFARLMKEQGNRCTLVPFEGKEHGFFNGKAFRPKSDGVDYGKTVMKTLSFLESLGLSPETESRNPPGSDRTRAGLDFEASPTDRAAWMNEEKFGLFIHWGLYAALERGEWVMHKERIPVETYCKLADSFNPVKFDARQWVRVAKNAGMKYITITSKHHDGFAMFDSDASDYNIVDATPFKRDVIHELKEACDAEGLKLCLYYSHAQDWYHRGGMPWYNWKEKTTHQDFSTYLEEVSLPQVREIVERYEPAVVWFDTPSRMTPDLSGRFVETVRSIRPETVINSRLLISGREAENATPDLRKQLRELGVDFLSFADRSIPADSPWPYWETCMTLNGAWGFHRQDQAWKSPEQVIQQLIEVVSKGGTFLLNVGPDQLGVIPGEAVQILEQVGAWLAVNGEAVYGAERTELQGPGELTAAYWKHKAAAEKRAEQLGRMPHVALEMAYEWLATGREGKRYISLFQWPGEVLELDGIPSGVKAAYFLSDPSVKVNVEAADNKLRVQLPGSIKSERVPVLCLEME